MSTLGLHHVNIRVPREMLESVRDFYCSALGLRQGDRPPFGSFGYWLYAGENAVVHLSTAGTSEARRTDAATTLDHVAFRCVSFVAMTEKLGAMGVDVQIDEVPATGHRQVFFSDPAGNGVELNFAEEGSRC